MYVRRFDTAFAAWQPDRFARDLVVGTLKASLVVVGENFRFGAKRAGDLSCCAPSGRSWASVSGSTPSRATRTGATRARALARPWSPGTSTRCGASSAGPTRSRASSSHGDERGRTIGVPTANLGAVTELLPPKGVYAVTADRYSETGRELLPLARGVTNIGVRPTVGAGGLSVETYLLDFDGDLYDARLRMHLLARLRDEKKFGSLDELKAQIARDVADARAVLPGA